MSAAARALPWVVRATWGALAFVAGPALADAFAARSAAVQDVGAIGLWAGWAVVLCASLVAHPVALTVLRLGAVSAVAASIAALVAAPDGASVTTGAVAALSTAIVALVSFLPETAMPYVNGPAYPNERRFPLRPPGPLLIGPLELAWSLTVGAPAAGALLLAARQWIAGGLCIAVGAASIVVLGRSMHALSRRWLVFVPAGVVVHDPLTLADPILIRRRDIVAFGPAPADTEATDLTARAIGLALEIRTATPAVLALVKPGSRAAAATQASALLVTPSRPGAVLAEAAARRLATALDRG